MVDILTKICNAFCSVLTTLDTHILSFKARAQISFNSLYFMDFDTNNLMQVSTRRQIYRYNTYQFIKPLAFFSCAEGVLSLCKYIKL